ncbi:DsrE family protein [Candidatus Methylacidiphilum infernorum]|uniref:DrsE family protein n=1 Tax=Methylacidiphilum infernorum (isolate V4) TaxID=481448 RepID=B3E0T0_METI4|nr:DsrE family protein [Candidatus Methylacidiphilum infernorum]ACD82834.1 DrsE family protein [Methylacidiphilum infernorum V4]
MQSVLIVITQGKEAFQRVHSLFHMSQVLAQQEETQVELLFLGPGVEWLRSNQRSSPLVAESLDQLRRTGIDIVACEVSLEAFGVEENKMLPARKVKGAVEMRKLIGQGFTVLSF